MPSTTELLQFGPFVAIVFFLLWGAWVIIPKALDKHEVVVTKIAADHKESVERLTAEHKSTVDGLVREFRAELKEQRDRNEEEHTRRDAAIGKLADAVDRIGAKVSGT